MTVFVTLLQVYKGGHVTLREEAVVMEPMRSVTVTRKGR